MDIRNKDDKASSMFSKRDHFSSQRSVRFEILSILDFGFSSRFKHVDQKIENLDDRVAREAIHHEGSIFKCKQGRKFERRTATLIIAILLLPSLFLALESFIGLSLPRVLLITPAGKQKKEAERTRIEVKFAVQIESLPGESGFANASLLSFSSFAHLRFNFREGKLPDSGIFRQQSQRKLVAWTSCFYSSLNPRLF